MSSHPWPKEGSATGNDLVPDVYYPSKDAAISAPSLGGVYVRQFPAVSVSPTGLGERVSRLEKEIRELKQSANNRATEVRIESLAPDPYRIIRPLFVALDTYEDEYRVSFLEANLEAYGCTRTEAVSNFKDILVATLDRLLTDESRLGPGPARELAVLKEFVAAV